VYRDGAILDGMPDEKPGIETLPPDKQEINETMMVLKNIEGG